MYYNNKKLILSIVELVIGSILIVLGIKGKIDSTLWSGAGGGLVAVGVAQIIRTIKYKTDPEFKKTVDTELTDERLKYLRLKAWAFAGYAFLISSGVVAIGLMITGKREPAMILGFCICFMLIAYLVSYVIIQRKE